METWKGRPEITGIDHPKTVYRALLGGRALQQAGMLEADACAWSKTAQDAIGSIQDGFGLVDPDYDLLNPEGQARLYMSIDQLERALTGYGCQLLDENPDYGNEEISNIDELLKSIDRVK